MTHGLKKILYFLAVVVMLYPSAVLAQTDTVCAIINYQMRGPEIPDDYVGLSYERLALVTQPDGSHYFDSNKQAFVNVYKTLGVKSLRIGGSSLEVKKAQAPTNEDIDFLFGFARKAGAKVIYSFPLDSAKRAEDARQAAHIFNTYRQQLSLFAIGNEPGHHKDYNNFLAPTWRSVMEAVRHEAPDVPFIAPDDNPNPFLSTKLWRDFSVTAGGPITMLGLHSYPAGCSYINPNTAKSDSELIFQNAHWGCDYLLSDSLPSVYSDIYDEMESVFRDYPFRLSETGNFWYGGLKGASNAYATSLWVIDYMYWWAWRGAQGMNFHGGGAVGAESRTPWYTAFMQSIEGIKVRPLSYALKVFSLGAHGHLVPVTLSGAGDGLIAYATTDGHGYTYLTLINKRHTGGNQRVVHVSLSDCKKPIFTAHYVLLQQQNGDIYSTEGITLGGDSVHADGTMPSLRWTAVPFSNGQIILTMPQASAIVLKLGTDVRHIIRSINEQVQTGRYEPDWKSLSRYQVPEWFRDAKFGIWAHWGPQSVPEYGDWYARFMYQQGSREYKYHLQHYGHPSQVGFKDLVHQWTASNWNPEKLMRLYKRAGAQYFVAMANHHDNFDNWASRYNPWNATQEGPHSNIVAGWERAARKCGLRFGISIHASKAWNWYDVTENSDQTGSMKGIPYDGVLTAADGKGKWWNGLNPRQLYARDHSLSGTGATDKDGKDTTVPDSAWCELYFDRTMDVINQTRPDLVYFDDAELPLWPVSDAGLKLAAHYYNSNMLWHNGREEGVITGKALSPEEQKCLVWDVERGALPYLNQLPWQTCTCLGSWHYDRTRFTKNTYKTALRVVRMLADIVSKNGNMLLSVPIRADGTIDEREEQILDSVATWMEVNRECIFGTRPWTHYGEGPDVDKAVPMTNQIGFNETKKDYTSQDIRFTTKPGCLYAILFKRPVNGHVIIKSLAGHAHEIAHVEVLGQGRTRFTCDSEGLKLDVSAAHSYVPVVKITFHRNK